MSHLQVMLSLLLFQICNIMNAPADEMFKFQVSAHPPVGVSVPERSYVVRWTVGQPWRQAPVSTCRAWAVGLSPVSRLWPEALTSHSTTRTYGQVGARLGLPGVLPEATSAPHSGPHGRVGGL